MSTRHLIAYLILAALVAGICLLAAAYRRRMRADRLRRRSHRRPNRH